MYQQRIRRVVAAMEAMGLSQLLVSDPMSIRYLTGVMIEPHERLFALYLRQDGNHIFFLNKLFVVPPHGFAEVWFSDTDDFLSMLAEKMDHSAPLGVDKNFPARFLIPLIEKHAASAYRLGSLAVDETRAQKDAGEQAKMKKASAINDAAIERLAKWISVGITERQAVEKLLEIYAEEGGEGVSFDPIVAFGGNAADPHHEVDDSVLQAGECVLIDMGCRYQGYCSDMTRTFFAGVPTEKQQKIHDIVRLANEKAESIIRPGIRFCDIDAAARDLITEAGYGDYFTHRLGHSIGAECHEFGDVSSANTAPVQEGMIFSIEPGIYLPGEIGVRIEDLVLVTANGCEILNHVPKIARSIGK